MRAIGTLETWGRDVAAWDLEALEGCLWAEMDWKKSDIKTVQTL